MRYKFLVAVLVFLVSCSSNDQNDQGLTVLSTLTGENEFSFYESLERWNQLKETNGNSYIYQTSFYSWVGWGYVTEVRVDNGEVIARLYEEFTTNYETGEREVNSSYYEDAINLGTHTNGSAPVTLDVLYTECSGEYLSADQQSNTLSFETTEDGIMTSCGYTPNGCQDDCYQGFNITGFEWHKF